MRASFHIPFLRSENRVGNAGAVPDSDEKTEAIEPSSFGLRVGEWVDRNLSEASKGVHGTEDVRTRGHEARCMARYSSYSATWRRWRGLKYCMM